MPTSAPRCLWFSLSMTALLGVAFPAGVRGTQAETVIQVVSGVTETGGATGKWLEIMRRRLAPEEYDSVAAIRKTFTPSEKAWEALIRARVAAWTQEIPRLAGLIRPTAPPDEVLIVIGNRGTSDAFTHDPRTMGFNLEALQTVYGDAELAVNADRVDRFLRHEYVHLLQKAWLAEHPWAEDSPLREALQDIWAEGLGNYQSLSSRWSSRDGKRSEATSRALEQLEPRFVARLAAIACATPEAAARLMADLSFGRFDRKWGALPPALWLAEEQDRSPEALRDFFVAGPDAVWDLADRHLPAALGAALSEARMAASLCSGGS